MGAMGGTGAEREEGKGGKRGGGEKMFRMVAENLR